MNVELFDSLQAFNEQMEDQEDEDDAMSIRIHQEARRTRTDKVDKLEEAWAKETARHEGEVYEMQRTMFGIHGSLFGINFKGEKGTPGPRK